MEESISLSICFLLLISFNTFTHAAVFRVEAQAGVYSGDTEVNFVRLFDGASVSGKADSDIESLFGIGMWLDAGENSPLSNFSFGFQYNRMTEADINITGFNSFRIENDLFIFNLLIRDNYGTLFNNRKFHPYIGGGAGFTYTAADFETSLLGPFIEEDSWFGTAFQFMAGLDYDITENIYFGVNASYLLINIDEDGEASCFIFCFFPTYTLDVEQDTFRVLGVIGYKF